MPKKKGLLQQYKYADVSTRHITKKDAELLEQAAKAENDSFERMKFPFTIAAYPEGFFISLPGKQADFAENMESLIQFGLSFDCIKLFGRCVKEGAYVLRLDRDAYEVEGIKKFDW
jgi:hypothetical protein